MSTNLYETLALFGALTVFQPQVRKAYRRKALETHPDRLPQNASASQKAASEEMFRKVMHSCAHVASDPSTDMHLYDEHGIWPPPAPQMNGWRGGRDAFDDPFFRGPFSDPFFSRGGSDPFGNFGFGGTPPFRGFTDPFVLFNSIFGDLHRAFSENPFHDSPFGHPFGTRHTDPFGFMSPFSLMAGPSAFGFPGGNMQPISSSSRGMLSGGNGRWTSESWTTQTVNGVTQTKCVRRDSEGNESVLYKLPDGTVRHTVNGIEQPAGNEARTIEHVPRQDDRVVSQTLPPPPPYEAVVGMPSVQPHTPQPQRDGRSGTHRFAIIIVTMDPMEIDTITVANTKTDMAIGTVDMVTRTDTELGMVMGINTATETSMIMAIDTDTVTTTVMKDLHGSTGTGASKVP
ncbi:hypothetical protein ID866_4023 [Astraeus odoratus]|nr:hypothetical protein ID866_4023 [Astraeus odoratus]